MPLKGQSLRRLEGSVHLPALASGKHDGAAFSPGERISPVILLFQRTASILCTCAHNIHTLTQIHRNICLNTHISHTSKNIVKHIYTNMHAAHRYKTTEKQTHISWRTSGSCVWEERVETMRYPVALIQRTECRPLVNVTV